MAFKDFTSGAVLTAADVDTYLMQQAVIVCTAATRPSAPVEGMTIFETDTDKFLVYDGSGWVEFSRISAWTAYSPAWTNLTVGNGTVDASYIQHGKKVTYRGSLIWGSTTSISGSVQVAVPVAAKALSGGVGRQLGMCGYEDATAQFYGGWSTIQSGASVAGMHHLAAGNAGNVNATNPFTFATGDGIFWYIEYEAA